MVVERIKELERQAREAAEQQRQRDKAIQETNAQNQIKQQNLRDVAAKKDLQEKQQEEARKNQEIERFMQESGIQTEMQRINEELLHGVKHDLIIGTHDIELVWGKYKLDREGRIITYDYDALRPTQDYSLIKATFHYDKESTVNINGNTTITRSQWEANRGIFIEALSGAYFQPKRVHSEAYTLIDKIRDNWPRGDSSSSGSGDLGGFFPRENCCS